MSSPDLSIVVPCYNEAGNIPLIINRFKEILSTSSSQVEVVLVNNGSTDHSSDVFKEELEKVSDARFRVIDVPENKGYGFGILSGLASAKGNVMAWTHADMQTDPEDVLKAYQCYQQNGDPLTFVKGKRQQRAPIPLFFTWGMGLISSLALKAGLHDIGAQPKLFSRSFYETYLQKGAPHDFSLDLYAQYWAQKKGTIKEVPVYFAKRLHGEAKGGGNLKTRIKVTRRVLKFIFELRERLVKDGQL